MASVDDKGCYNPSTKSYNLDSHTIMKSSSNSRKALSLRAKPTPSKWDDAQKWLMGLSDHKHNSTSKPRNSNAEDRRLLAPMPSKGRDSCGSIDDALPIQHQEEETKKIDVSNKSLEEVAVEMRSVSLRDMGTEMTPTASKEPSRTGTPLRARSPVNSRHSSPREPCSSRAAVSDSKGVDGKLSSLESRALAWDEAEKAKYMARYKREEVRIQAWENREMRKAEMRMKKIEVKAERMKSRAQEKLASKTATTRRRAEEKRLSAEAKLNERAAKTSERAEYVRRAGHLPSSFFSYKLPSLCGG
ncbi:uncharacterized protein A4U43_C02F9930 [Asparagus officinalis]|uniref:Remorin C-terminal domain-containing protein n=1 Tax=Asparagus officinalis TaxID=4686 RepID=A0A5P1FHD1_ASPOF|nr:remorin-like [Asparagus officinalis]XP_020253395.1 remorin-like [Asparagus officinalis]XP_020253396.1 remorin-like [Asparagus officinalis]XP_020253397.1 remorin-like [Asparagus officinalis]XP_020253398.1 remorin-like [Asparagus officinalis]XP_020253399.1 remorin-like [Asparagus officinalis]ONK77728.1 uncharacterized protein A4U43_C02F9930 [Asparagus officinalis]